MGHGFAGGAIVTSILLLFAAAASPPEARAQEFHLEVQERILDNGLQVLVVERENHPGRVGARIFYRSDIAGERPGTVGLTHMLEHHLFKGSHFLGTTDWEAEREVAERVERTARAMEDEKNRLADCFRQRELFSEYERACRTDRLDALTEAYLEARDEQEARFTVTQPDRTAYMAAGATGLTASTGRDWMKYHADLPANRLEAFMWIERSRVDNPVFREFDPEKEVVIEQIRRAFNRADAAFNRAMRSMTYEANPYGWAHWFSDLEGATREDHWEIYHKYFTPQNTVIVVVGDIEAQDVFELAERYWGDWPPMRHSPRLRTVEPVPAGERRLTVRAEAGPLFQMNVQVPAVGHEDEAALNVLAELLTGRDGLLMRRMGGELADAAAASHWVAKYPSHFTLTVQARGNQHLPVVESEVDALLGEIAQGALDPVDVEGAVRTLTFRYVSGFEDAGDAAVTLGSFAAIHRWDHVNELPRMWAAVGVEDLSRVSRRYFQRDMRVVGHLIRESLQANGEPADATGIAHQPEAPNPATKEAGRTAYSPFSVPSSGLLLSGGPVGEFSQPLSEWTAGSVGETRSTGGSFPSDPSSLPRSPARADADDDPRFRPLGPDPEPVPGRWEMAAPQIELRPGEPIPIAENPWYAPPWMAYRRAMMEAVSPSRPQTLEDIRYPEAPPFTPPSPEEYAVPAPGGMTAVVVPDRSLPLIRASVALDLSRWDEPAGKEGLREVAQEILLEAGAGDLSVEARRARMDALGISSAVSVQEHRLRFDYLAPSDAGEELVELLGAWITSPGFDEEAFAGIRARVEARARRADDDPSPSLDRLFDATAFGGDHPVARHPTPSSIAAVTFQDVVDLLEEALTGRRLGLALSGDLPADLPTSWIRSAFSDLPRGQTPRRSALPDPDAATGRLVTADRESAQGFVKMGYPGFRGMPGDHAAFELMHYILVGAGQGGHLFQLLRTKLGLTAAVWGEADPRENGPTTWEIRFAGNPPTLAEAVRQTCRAVDHVRQEGLTPEEFERAKVAYLEGHVPSVYRTPHLVAQRLVERELLGRYDYIRTNYLNYYAGDERQMAAVQGVSLEEVNRLAREYLRPEEMTIAVVGPLDTIRAGSEAYSGELATCGEVLGR
jgi:predicted Zn-dependent peptidase